MTTANSYLFHSAYAIKRPFDSSAWTIPLMCVGIGIIACCVLLPAANDNRRLLAQTQYLQADLDQIKQQITINDQFLKSVADDPTLLERLAARQMKMVREGESVLPMKNTSAHAEMSPYSLVNLPPPPAKVEDHPVGGLLGELVDSPRTRLFAMGAALLLMATGLVMGANPIARPTSRR